MMMPDESPASAESVASESPESPGSADDSGGYIICLRVSPDGTFTVWREAGHEGNEPDAARSEYEQLDSIEQALKAVLLTYQQHPLGDTAEQDAMDATFAAHQPDGRMGRIDSRGTY